MVSTNEGGLILGFSLMGTFISPGEGLLTTVSATAENVEGYFDLSVTNFAGQGGTALDYEVGSPFLGNDEIAIVDEFSLSNNYPNPFNPSTTIDFAVAQSGDVSVIIYDMLGREVKNLVNGFHTPNYYSINWNGMNDAGTSVSTGVYYYKMVSSDFVEMKKMMFVK